MAEADLTEEEVKLLNILCKRWEEQINWRNKKLLEWLYDEYGLQLRGKYKNLELVDLETLKNDFVGNSKPFKNLLELFIKIGRIVDQVQASEFRLKTKTGSVIIIHTGRGTLLVLTSIKPEKVPWTYKIYNSTATYEMSLRKKGDYAEGIRYSELISGIPELKAPDGEIIRFPSSRERYYGLNLQQLWRVANVGERERLTKMSSRLKLLGLLEISGINITYDPSTKKLWRVDIG